MKQIARRNSLAVTLYLLLKHHKEIYRDGYDTNRIEIPAIIKLSQFIQQMKRTDVADW